MSPRWFNSLIVTGCAALAAAWWIYLDSASGPAGAASTKKPETLLASLVRPNDAAPRQAGAVRGGKTKLRQRLSDWAEQVDDAMAVARANVAASAVAAEAGGYGELRAGHTERAVEQFDRAIRAHPEDLSARRGRAMALTKMRRLAEAAREYERIVGAARNAVDNYNYGVVLCGLQRLTAAEDQFRRATTIDPKYDRAIYNLASVYQQEGALEAAAREWTRFCARQPRVSSAWFNQGIAWLDLGNPEKARNCFRRVIEQQSEDPIAYQNLAEACRQTNRSDEAIGAYERALALVPDDRETMIALIELHRTMADAGRDAGRHRNAALELSRKILMLDPEQAELRAFVEETEAKMGASGKGEAR